MRSDRARIVAPPPLIYAAGFLAALALHWAWPLPIATHAAVTWAGAALLGLGLMLDIWGASSLFKARTAINPYRPSTSIVAMGAYRLSRNPIYLGLTLSFLGLSFIFNTLWGPAVLAPVLIGMHYGVILREESYLEQKFGDAYRRYRTQVRRYL